MTDKEKILAEIKKRVEFQKTCIKTDYRLNGRAEEEIILEYQKLINFINSLPEEPVSEDIEKEANECWDYVFSALGWDENSLMTMDHEEFLAFACHFADWQKEKDESYTKSMYKVGINEGKELMKQQMMKDAVSAYIRRNRYTKTNVLNGFDVTCDAVQKFKDKDKVKVIIIKED